MVTRMFTNVCLLHGKRERSVHVPMPPYLHYVTRVHLHLAVHRSLRLSNAYHTPPVNGQCFGDKMEPILPAQSLCG